MGSVKTDTVTAAAAAAECVSLLLSDGYGDVRVLCARDVVREAEGRGFLQQRVVEHGRLQASLLSAAPAWMTLESREVCRMRSALSCAYAVDVTHDCAANAGPAPCSKCG